MSQRPLLIRVSGEELDRLRQQDASYKVIECIVEEAEEHHQFSSYWDHDAPFDRLLSMSPFTHARLLHIDAEKPLPLDSALLNATDILDVEYGLGNVQFHPVEDVQKLAVQLADVPEDVVRARFVGEIEYFAGESKPTDIEYQINQFRRLVAFYQQAAQHDQIVLIAIM